MPLKLHPWTTDITPLQIDVGANATTALLAAPTAGQAYWVVSMYITLDATGVSPSPSPSPSPSASGSPGVPDETVIHGVRFLMEDSDRTQLAPAMLLISGAPMVLPYSGDLGHAWIRVTDDKGLSIVTGDCEAAGILNYFIYQR